MKGFLSGAARVKFISHVCLFLVLLTHGQEHLVQTLCHLPGQVTGLPLTHSLSTVQDDETVREQCGAEGFLQLRPSTTRAGRPLTSPGVTLSSGPAFLIWSGNSSCELSEKHLDKHHSKSGSEFPDL